MKQGTFTIWKNNAIISGVHKLTLYGDTSAITRPGQFADVHIDGHFLRRPFSVCDWDKDVLVLVYRLIGQGTRDLAAKQPGEGLDILTGLGNGFDTSLSGDHPLLVAGGSGVPMMLALTKQLVREGKQVTALLGYRTAGDIFMDDDIRAAGADVIVTTEDGSFGRKGMVTDVMPELDYSYFYTCGPEAMFRAVDAVANTSGQFSFEARMGCGYGACMGCTCQTKYGAKRICKDGPVLTREEIVW
ncbi:MAG: dihydroorotate dehydrogenase electron transfer subunit [Oscillospiraceae bacterium]|nr:dihydroorotate dehydrogenase electron transfer subunit [Oscillospiraceae bacterium]